MGRWCADSPWISSPATTAAERNTFAGHQTVFVLFFVDDVPNEGNVVGKHDTSILGLFSPPVIPIR